MKLQMNDAYALGYKSASQIARRVTEGWAKDNLYCVACTSSSVAPEGANAEAVDFRCNQCSAPYQLKASKSWSVRRVPDAGYGAMMRALHSDSIPNLLLMQYSIEWVVCNLMLIPSFFFTTAAIEKREPLGPTARRAGWVGCNILLSEIAEDGKILVVSNGNPVPSTTVRSKYERVRPFSEVHVLLRGWTLDVFRMIQRLGRARFSLDDIYRYEDALSSIYPENRNIRPKIRQQLQVLRDLGYIRFRGHGRYELPH